MRFPGFFSCKQLFPRFLAVIVLSFLLKDFTRITPSVLHRIPIKNCPGILSSVPFWIFLIDIARVLAGVVFLDYLLR